MGQRSFQDLHSCCYCIAISTPFTIIDEEEVMHCVNPCSEHKGLGEILLSELLEDSPLSLIIEELLQYG